MGRFRNLDNGVVVSVDDSKDERFESGWEPFDGDDSKSTAKKSTSRRSSSKSED